MGMGEGSKSSKMRLRNLWMIPKYKYPKITSFLFICDQSTWTRLVICRCMGKEISEAGSSSSKYYDSWHEITLLKLSFLTLSTFSKVARDMYWGFRRNFWNFFTPNVEFQGWSLTNFVTLCVLCHAFVWARNMAQETFASRVFFRTSPRVSKKCDVGKKQLKSTVMKIFQILRKY